MRIDLAIEFPKGQLFKKSIILNPQDGTVTLLCDRVFTDEQGNILARKPNIANSLKRDQAEKIDIFGKFKPLVSQFWQLLQEPDTEPSNKVFKIDSYTKNGGLIKNGSTYVKAAFASGELSNGSSISISGCDEEAYNGTFIITRAHSGYGRFSIPIKFISNPNNKGSFIIN